MNKVIDNLSSISWFLMDAAWMFGFKYWALFMIFPSIALTFHGFFYSRVIPKFLVQFATFNWLLMNIFWMLVDVKFMENMLYAKCFFIVGLLSIIGVVSLDINQLKNFKRFK